MLRFVGCWIYLCLVIHCIVQNVHVCKMKTGFSHNYIHVHVLEMKTGFSWVKRFLGACVSQPQTEIRYYLSGALLITWEQNILSDIS